MNLSKSVTFSEGLVRNEGVSRSRIRHKWLAGITAKN
jgi:hypothetical protein